MIHVMRHGLSVRGKSVYVYTKLIQFYVQPIIKKNQGGSLDTYTYVEGI